MLAKNNERSTLPNIISGVPHGSIVGTTFNYFINHFLSFILIATAHNFAYDYISHNLATTVDSLNQT